MCLCVCTGFTGLLLVLLNDSLLLTCCNNNHINLYIN